MTFQNITKQIVVLNEEDIEKIIAEKFNVSTSSVNLGIREIRDDWGDHRWILCKVTTNTSDS